MEDFIISHGLPLLFLVIAVESFGVPVPGETALIAFGVLASQGHYPIEIVIIVAALAAIIGDNLGYWLIGRVGGQKLLHRWNWLGRYADKVLPRATVIMERHGGKTVFFGRFVAVLRYTVAWVAGITGMEWRKFFTWNVIGGIIWATGVGLLAYFGGNALAHTVAKYGVIAGVVICILFIGFFLLVRRGEKRLEERL